MGRLGSDTGVIRSGVRKSQDRESASAPDRDCPKMILDARDGSRGDGSAMVGRRIIGSKRSMMSMLDRSERGLCQKNVDGVEARNAE